jgi:uncharacterized heparinase superfamily protein
LSTRAAEKNKDVAGLFVMDRLIGSVRLAGFAGQSMLPHLLPRRLIRLLPVVTPERLLVAPPEIVAGDAAIAADLYAGYFVLAGHAVAADGRSIFDAEPPAFAWGAALNSFTWLTHLRASDTTLARIHARALIEDWVAHPSRGRVRMSSIVTAQRVMAWMVHAPFLLEGAAPRFHRRFLRSLSRQVRRLRWEYATTPPGLPRLTTALALTMAGLCFADGGKILKTGTRRLTVELEKQILPDGAHISRNPAMLLSILNMLLPLKDTFISREVPPPSALLNAIDRMMPMVRFFQHGDGTFALFNGMGGTPFDLVKAVLSFDDAKGKPVRNAPHSGYQRLESGDLVALMDTGAPPPLGVSRKAHAGTLSFELSSGAQRIIVNCGAPETGEGVWSLAARATAAHSTAGVNDASSCRFVRVKWLQNLFGAPIVSGPRNVPVARDETTNGDVLRASHDGYLRRFGLIHERTWRLGADGASLDGVDVFRHARRRVRAGLPYAIRFHLHPDATAAQDESTGTVRITLANGEKWMFVADGIKPRLEESVHLADARGVCRTTQILIASTVKDMPRVAWAFTRMG